MEDRRDRRCWVQGRGARWWSSPSYLSLDLSGGPGVRAASEPRCAIVTLWAVHRGPFGGGGPSEAEDHLKRRTAAAWACSDPAEVGRIRRGPGSCQAGSSEPAEFRLAFVARLGSDGYSERGRAASARVWGGSVGVCGVQAKEAWLIGPAVFAWGRFAVRSEAYRTAGRLRSRDPNLCGESVGFCEALEFGQAGLIRTRQFSTGVSLAVRSSSARTLGAIPFPKLRRFVGLRRPRPFGPRVDNRDLAAFAPELLLAAGRILRSRRRSAQASVHLNLRCARLSVTEVLSDSRTRSSAKVDHRPAVLRRRCRRWLGRSRARTTWTLSPFGTRRVS